jgi:predicted nucleotidyltransferase
MTKTDKEFQAAMVAINQSSSDDIQLGQIIERIAVSYMPEKIILFGSRAYGSPDADSDFDLLIIKETSDVPRERRYQVRKILWLLPLKAAVEPIVLTQAELMRRMGAGDSFINKIVREGRIL